MKHGIFLLFENLQNDEKKCFKEAFKCVKLVDKLAFDEAWISEHHFNSFSLTSSPTVLASYALAKTKKIKIGVAGFIIPSYDVLRLASDISNLQNISDNRLLISFAKGSFPIIDKIQGRDPAHNRKIMLENIDKLNEIFNNYHIKPKPKKAKFFLASVHEDSLSYAAKHSYGILASMKSSIEDIMDIKKRYKNVAGFEPKIGVIRAINIHEDKEKSLHEASNAISFFFEAMTNAKNKETFKLVKGSEYEKLRQDFFDPKLIEKFAITGSVNECLEEITHLKQITNIDKIILKPAALSYKRHKQILTTYAKEIMPYV